MKNILIIFLFFTLVSCDDANDNTNENSMISGYIYHDQSGFHSLNSDYKISKNTRISVQVYYVEAMDGSAEIILNKTFSKVKRFPYRYKIEGEWEEIFRNHEYPYYFSIRAEVYNSLNGGGCVGDLVSEQMYGGNFNNSEVDISVSGLEHCDSEIAGGFCSSNICDK